MYAIHSVFVFLCVIRVALATQFSHLREETFSNIKNLHQQQFVVFYSSSKPDHIANLREIDNAAATVTNEFPFMKFLICDGDAEVNKQEFAEASFKDGFYMFTQVNEQGIQKYAHEAKADVIVEHIRDLFASFDPSDVSTFSTEDAFFEWLDSDDTPVVVKFFENWCTHCKALKKPFHIAATKLRGRARFLEVECSKNEDTRAFCAKHEARAFPVMMIFDSERKAKFEYESRSVIFMKDFVDKFMRKVIGVPHSSSVAITATVTSSGNVEVSKSTLAQTPNKPSLGTEGSLAARVASLERMVEALATRLEQVEGRR